LGAKTINQVRPLGLGGGIYQSIITTKSRLIKRKLGVQIFRKHQRSHQLHLSSQSGGLFPDLPVGDRSVDLYCDWELQVIAMISELLCARVRAQTNGRGGSQWRQYYNSADCYVSVYICYLKSVPYILLYNKHILILLHRFS
jgi:hypothetical protein